MKKIFDKIFNWKTNNNFSKFEEQNYEQYSNKYINSNDKYNNKYDYNYDYIDNDDKNYELDNKSSEKLEKYDALNFSINKKNMNNEICENKCINENIGINIDINILKKKESESYEIFLKNIEKNYEIMFNKIGCKKITNEIIYYKNLDINIANEIKKKGLILSNQLNEKLEMINYFLGIKFILLCMNQLTKNQIINYLSLHNFDYNYFINLSNILEENVEKIFNLILISVINIINSNYSNNINFNNNNIYSNNDIININYSTYTSKIILILLKKCVNEFRDKSRYIVPCCYLLNPIYDIHINIIIIIIYLKINNDEAISIEDYLYRNKNNNYLFDEMEYLILNTINWRHDILYLDYMLNPKEIEYIDKISDNYDKFIININDLIYESKLKIIKIKKEIKKLEVDVNNSEVENNNCIDINILYNYKIRKLKNIKLKMIKLNRSIEIESNKLESKMIKYLNPIYSNLVKL